MTTVYGITNCSTVKKARAWLQDNGIDYDFADFKKTPPTAEQIENWRTQLGMAALLNKRGTTWRKLTPEQQSQADSEAGAAALMMAHPSLIKRPVVEHNGQILCGFDETAYTALFNGGGADEHSGSLNT